MQGSTLPDPRTRLSFPSGKRSRSASLSRGIFSSQPFHMAGKFRRTTLAGRTIGAGSYRAQRRPVRSMRGSRLNNTGWGRGGTTKLIRAGVGREVPLYLPPSNTMIETHHKPFRVDNGGSGINPFNASNGNIHLINGVAQGNSIDSRDDYRITMHRLRVRGDLSVLVTAAQPVANICMAIVYDLQPEADLPDIGAIFTRQFTGRDLPTDFQSTVHRERFQVLYRTVRTVSRTANTSAALASSKPFIEFSLDLAKRQAAFGTANGLIADITRGALYFVLTTDTNDSGPAYQIHCDLVFAP